MKLLPSVVAALLALSVLCAPIEAAARARHGGRTHRARPSYPMQATDFRVLVAKRMEAVRALIDKTYGRSAVGGERRAALLRYFDDACGPLRTAFNRAVADGIVTRGEAEKVDAQISGLRTRVQERLRVEKHTSEKSKTRKARGARKPSPVKAASTRRRPGARPVVAP